MKVITIILGVLTTLLGIFCVFRPGVAALSLAWLLGIILILAGFNIVTNYFGKKIGSGWDAFFGILSIVGGIILICNYYGRFLRTRSLFISSWLLSWFPVLPVRLAPGS